jgi:hypothetical protein
MILDACNVFQKQKQQNKWQLKMYFLIKRDFLYSSSWVIPGS